MKDVAVAGKIWGTGKHEPAGENLRRAFYLAILPLHPALIFHGTGNSFFN